MAPLAANGAGAGVADEGLAPLWAGFPGHGGLQTDAGKVELHAPIVARAFYGGKRRSGGIRGRG